MTLYLFSGLPVPVITWRRNRVTVNGQMDSSEPGLIRSTLLLPPLKRTDWPMTLSCSASNWERGRPLEQSFDVDMERKSIRLSVWMRLISVQRTAPAATRERMNFLSFIQVGRATERTVPNSALRKGCVGNRINRITRARWTDLTGQTREGGNNANRNLASASAVLSVFYWASALAVYNRPSRWFARPLLCTLFPILAVVFCNVAASVCLVVFPQFFLTAQLRFPEDGRLLFPLARNYVQHCVPYESNSYRPSWSSYSFELSTSSQTAKTHHLNPISFSDVNLYLNWTVPPLSVAIVVGERNPAAGRPFSLPCHVTGSRPTPKITWWRNDVLLDPSTHNQVRSSQ